MSTAPAPSRLGHWLAAAAILAVVVTLVAAFLVMRSPSDERMRRLDQRRVDELSTIQQAVEAYFRTHDRLPADLDAAATGFFVSRNDPVTGQPYEYAVVDARTYRLCAVFDADTTAEGDMATARLFQWAHGAGRHCFERVAPDGRAAMPAAPYSAPAEPVSGPVPSGSA